MDGRGKANGNILTRYPHFVIVIDKRYKIKRGDNRCHLICKHLHPYEAWPFSTSFVTPMLSLLVVDMIRSVLP